MRYNKYHNKRVITPDGKFDSKKEHIRFMELQIMQKAGIIKDLKRQVKYELIPSQRVAGKVVERSVSYIADFEYTEAGQKVVEDVKGLKTDVYIIKRKLMLQRYGIQIKEV